ncbi:protein of unknown function [Nitrosotalea devaniterrae]|uniref:Uncharacterized protein n=1 Tax=Nitrosotalea devaniterrae TaxID=1078905 RepID=A0A128A4K9_9ARCH|nr:protein of unknown function [Candidatus Nitrosotalea devanaterra]
MILQYTVPMSDMQQFVKPHELYSYEKVREMLVHTVLEKALANAGIYHTVTSEIKKKYNGTLNDCYKHPEYLSTILEDKHDTISGTVSKSITKQLEMFSDDKSIANFLQAINS